MYFENHMKKLDIICVRSKSAITYLVAMRWKPYNRRDCDQYTKSSKCNTDAFVDDGSCGGMVLVSRPYWGRGEKSESIYCVLYQVLAAQYIVALIVSSYVPFSFGTFDSFLTGLGRNRVYNVCGSAKWYIHQFKPVQQNRKQTLRAYCPNIYIY